ncbi:MAG: hypothetical protein BRC29_03455 [Nanohaloarchaea archaeon SW_7_43_1]|nr:MAG: hypothetical protein BRC29_03455 [Nanohaloarchaea archaeon SW_7_43_1]
MKGQKKKSQELEWNIAKERIKKIAQILSKLRDAYEQAKHDRTRENVKAYYTYLNSLFQELYIYLPEDSETGEDEWGAEKFEEEIQELQRIMDKPGKRDKVYLKHFQDLEKIDRKLNKKRMDLGLDIPRKESWEEGKELLF